MNEPDFIIAQCPTCLRDRAFSVLEWEGFKFTPRCVSCLARPVMQVIYRPRLEREICS